MYITIDVDRYRLNVRAGVVIVHNNKILLHRNKNSDHYAMIGGRVEIGENSEHTIKRKIAMIEKSEIIAIFMKKT